MRTFSKIFVVALLSFVFSCSSNEDELKPKTETEVDQPLSGNPKNKDSSNARTTPTTCPGDPTPGTDKWNLFIFPTTGDDITTYGANQLFFMSVYALWYNANGTPEPGQTPAFDVNITKTGTHGGTHAPFQTLYTGVSSTTNPTGGSAGTVSFQCPAGQICTWNLTYTGYDTNPFMFCGDNAFTFTLNNVSPCTTAPSTSWTLSGPSTARHNQIIPVSFDGSVLSASGTFGFEITLNDSFFSGLSVDGIPFDISEKIRFERTYSCEELDKNITFNVKASRSSGNSPRAITIRVKSATNGHTYPSTGLAINIDPK